MATLKMQLRHALFISLRYYQHSIPPKQLVSLYHVPASIWKLLIRHGDLEVMKDQTVRLSDQGLADAKRWFPARKSELDKLKRTVDIELVSGYVFMTKVEVQGTKTIAHYLDDDGNDTTDFDHALFVPEQNWRRKKLLENKYDMRMVKMPKIVEKEPEDDVKPRVNIKSLFV